MKIKPTFNIDDAIEALQQQLRELEIAKKEQQKAIDDEIARQQKIKAELEAKNKFDDWHPSVGNMIEVIKMSDRSDNLQYFKNLKYTVGVYGIDYQPLDFGDGWNIKCRYRHGGGEGDGSEHYLILSVTQHGENETFWMIPGYYQSYNGAELELDSIHQVRPYQKTVTDYERI